MRTGIGIGGDARCDAGIGTFCGFAAASGLRVGREAKELCAGKGSG